MTTNEETTTLEGQDDRRDAAAEATSDPRVERTVEAAGQVVEAAVGIGRAWASYGLRVGRLALETQAQTMSKLADALGALNRSIEPRDEGAPAAPTDATPAGH